MPYTVTPAYAQAYNSADTGLSELSGFTVLSSLECLDEVAVGLVHM